MSRRIQVAGVAFVLLLGCSGADESVREAAETVLTLQSGTVNELRNKRGSGPFTTYDVPPDEMLEVLDRAARKARNDVGEPVQAVFVYENAREVVAKERSGDAAGAKAAWQAYLDAHPNGRHARMVKRKLER